MSEKKESGLGDNDAVEIFGEDNIITLYDDDNNPVEFNEIASIEHDEKFYALMQPANPVEGFEEDEAVIFEYIVEEGSQERTFKPIYDEELLTEVFNVYLKAVADYEYDECDCGCGCGCEQDECEEDGCGCGCGCEEKR